MSKKIRIHESKAKREGRFGKLKKKKKGCRLKRPCGNRNHVEQLFEKRRKISGTGKVPPRGAR